MDTKAQGMGAPPQEPPVLPGAKPETLGKILTTGPWFQRLMLLSVIFMPFQYALTVPVGFPLKISEILGIMGVAMYVLGRRSTRRKRDLAGVAVVALAIATVFSALVNLTPGSGGLRSVGYDRGYETDLLLYSGYALLALCYWAVLRRVARQMTVRAIVASIWLCGAAVLMQWASALSGNTQVIGILGFRTLGVDDTVETLRSGPFLEGQHLGFYAGAAILVALYNKSYLAAIVAALSILYSQSTTAYAGLAVGIAMIVILKFSKVVVPLIAAALVGVLALLFSDTLRTTLGRQLAKIGFTEFAPDYQYATTSLNLRGVKSQISFDMSSDNPIFGVGPGRYGAYFDQYVSGRQLPWIYSTDQTRPIAENAYAHVAAELGYVALIAFGLLVVVLLCRNFRSASLLGMLAVFTALGVSTQSSWMFLPIWTFFALLAADDVESKQSLREPPGQ
ncbi:O-antigen ligase family protein [Paenarthrobacter sp. YAF11_1]|uniref:O-antigen ligase family protein n=1 Tax=Paenarthrobacter sp. YAF11_1 TaxID=3233074 RepID=UPI003F9CCC57